MSIDIILRAICCLLSLCGRGKVKDRSLYILSPREGGRWVPGPLMVFCPPSSPYWRSVFYIPPLRHDMNKT